MSEPLFRSLEDAVVVAETSLLDVQLTVDTLRAELDQFTRLHQIQLGPLYLRLDELDALTAETEAAMTGDPEAIRRALEARARIDGTDLLEGLDTDILDDTEDDLLGDPAGRGRDVNAEQPTGQTSGDGTVDADGRIRPGKMAQRLYRDLARRSHPDLAQDPAEIARRSAFISRVNAAYEKDDLAALQRLGEEWSLALGGPDPSTPQREHWLRGRLIWLRARQAELTLERQSLLENPMADVLAAYQYDSLKALASIADQLYTAISERETMLNALIGPGPI
jgi:hypothetical protein